MWRRRFESREKLLISQRRAVFERTVATVTNEYFDPNFNGTDWPRLAHEAEDAIVGQDDPEEFEQAVNDLVKKLGTSHTGFYHRSVKRVPARLAVGATFGRAETDQGRLWMAQDVHPGGPAHTAGIRRGDVLVSIGDKSIGVDESPTFSMNSKVTVHIRRGCEERSILISVPDPSTRKQPYAKIPAVNSRILPDRVGYLQVTNLPGLLGLNVAREIDSAIERLSSYEGLILDLRGHLGGGLGVLRLMSYLTPEKLPIGYTVTRKLAQRGYDKAKLPRLDKLPTHLSNSLAIASMAVRFAGRDPSVLLVSEGCGRRQWHGRVVILVNEHTVSAGEMAAAFAAENELARIVGTETAGRLIPGSGFDVGHGYRLVMPKAEYVTWKGHRFEGRGVVPQAVAPWSANSCMEGDPQLEAAIRELSCHSEA